MGGVFGTLLLGFLQGLFRFFQVTQGPKTLFSDAKGVWLPLARQLATGATLYTGSAVDNKPPLFEFLNLGIYLTGHYVLVWAILIGVANAISALLLWRLLAMHGRERAGLVAALVLMGVLPFVGGLHVNVRCLALPLVLVALISRRATVSGIALALAGLFSQYAVLAIPVVLVSALVRSRTRRDALTWTVQFCALGLATAAVWFGAVAIVYGPTAMVNGMAWSVGLKDSYLTMTQKHSPFHTPVLYVADFVRLFVYLPYVFVPAAIGFGRALEDVRSRRWSLQLILASTAFLLGLSLLIRSFWTYWQLPIAFVVALAALVGEDFVSARVDTAR